MGSNNDSNNLPYYQLTVDPSCDIQGKSTFYLYNYQNIYWFIGSTVGSITTYALCQSTSNDPIDCSNNWSQGFGAANVQTSYGSCPEMDCSIITTSFPSNNVCSTIFNQKIGPNQWKGYNDILQRDVYFYFAPQYYEWICDDLIDNSCIVSAYDHAEVESEWNPLSPGSSMSLYFGASATTQTVNCLGMFVYLHSESTPAS